MMSMNIWIVASIAELIVIICLVVVFLMRWRKVVTDKSEDCKSNALRSNWTKALHDRFCEQWLTQFSKVSYPISSEDRVKVLTLIWNVASISIDCLMVNSNDVNQLQRHRDSVLYLTGETDHWGNLKEFHYDPSTVPYQVIAIYDILKELGYKGTIVAFGYQLIFD